MAMKDSVIILKSHLAKNGGAEKYTWRIAYALKQQGKSVTLLTNGPVSAPSGMKVISCPYSSPFSFRFVEKFDRFCSSYTRQNPADIIFGLDRNRFQTHLRASSGVHAAYLLHRQTQDHFFKKISHRFNPLHRTLLQIEKESFEHPKLKILIANSAMVKDEILSFYRTDPRKIHVVHNGVQWQEMASPFENWEQARRDAFHHFGLPASRFHFLFLGHNYRRKGLEPLLRAFSLLQQRDVHLSVVGKEKNLSHFQHLSRELGIADRVTFFGPCSDITTFYQYADTLVIPSFYDPFANVTVEALAMGLFVVTSKKNGGHEVITPDNGTVIEELSDPESIAESLRQALKKPKTSQSSLQIRNGVARLDFAQQLHQLLSLCS
jgi:UDP-glucose:(heptosyl)LPS alpha-1,3-glucosyltransferase